MGRAIWSARKSGGSAAGTAMCKRQLLPNQLQQDQPRDEYGVSEVGGDRLETNGRTRLERNSRDELGTLHVVNARRERPAVQRNHRRRLSELGSAGKRTSRAGSLEEGTSGRGLSEAHAEDGDLVRSPAGRIHDGGRLHPEVGFAK